MRYVKYTYDKVSLNSFSAVFRKIFGVHPLSMDLILFNLAGFEDFLVDALSWRAGSPA